MGVEQGLVARLSADDEILHLVYRTADEGIAEGEDPTSKGVRIWRNRPMMGCYPAIVYLRVGTDRGHVLDPAPSGLCESRFDLECWASVGKDARAAQLAKRVRILLDGKRFLSAGWEIAASWINDENDALRKPPGEKDAIWPVIVLTATIWYQEQTS